MRSILMMIIFGLLIISASSYCQSVNSSLPQINYTIHYENGTGLLVNHNSSMYAAINESAMKFVEFIAYASERLVTSDELTAELKGTKYLEITSADTMDIQTKKDLNPGWPLGYEIKTKKIMIKLGTAEAEERIYTFHDEGIPIRAWRSMKDVSSIGL